MHFLFFFSPKHLRLKPWSCSGSKRQGELRPQQSLPITKTNPSVVKLLEKKKTKLLGEKI